MYDSGLARLTVIFGIILLQFTFISCEIDLSVEDYLSVQRPFDAPKEIEWLTQQIELKGGDSPQETQAYLSEAFETGWKIASSKEPSGDTTGVSEYDRKSIHKLWDLISKTLALSEDNVYSSSQVEHFISLVDSTFNGLKNFDKMIKTNSMPSNNLKLFNYLKFYGSKASNLIMEKVSLTSFNLRVKELGYSVEEDFDMMGQPGNDQATTQQLRELDFLRGKSRMSLDKLIKLVKKSDTLTAREYPSNKNPLIVFMDRACPKVRALLGDMFDSYNFALIFAKASQSASLPAKFHKFNEYSRLCIQVLHSNNRKVASDFIEKNSSKSIMKKFF